MRLPSFGARHDSSPAVASISQRATVPLSQSRRASRERLRPFDGVLETQVLEVDQQALVTRGAPVAVLHERAQDLVRLGVLLVLLEEADAVPRRAREAIARVEALEPRGQRGDVVRVRRVLVEEAQARRREGLRDLARGRGDRHQGLLDGLRRRVLPVARRLFDGVVAALLGLLERGAGLLALAAGFWSVSTAACSSGCAQSARGTVASSTTTPRASDAASSELGRRNAASAAGASQRS